MQMKSLFTRLQEAHVQGSEGKGDVKKRRLPKSFYFR